MTHDPNFWAAVAAWCVIVLAALWLHGMLFPEVKP
jgi:hypothetical protein